MVEYLRTVEKATSVKSINVIRDPTSTSAGESDFGYRPVFSVFDYGTIQPSVPLDNSTVCLMQGFNFELLSEQGVDSHYLGLVDGKGELLSARDAITRGITSSTTRVQFVNRVLPMFRDRGGWDYSMFRDPHGNNYVHPMEFISRNELPESSSVWGRVERGELSLTDLGLPEDFEKGDPIPDELKPILDYSTKFEPDDRYVSPGVAQELLGIDDNRFDGINRRTIKSSNIMTDYAESRGFKRDDGKVEYIVVPGDGEIVDKLGDAVCTWHEDRLTIFGVGISKQRIRNKVKQLNPRWYADIQRAKQQAKDDGVEDFRTLMNPSINYTSPSSEFFQAINKLFQAGTNQWVDSKVYDVYPGKAEPIVDSLERAVEEFQVVA